MTDFRPRSHGLKPDIQGLRPLTDGLGAFDGASRFGRGTARWMKAFSGTTASSNRLSEANSRAYR